MTGVSYATSAEMAKELGPFAGYANVLAVRTDLGQQQVAAVALALLGRERARHLDGVAAVLPQRDAAGERLHALVRPRF
jgi:hypothetical protein